MQTKRLSENHKIIILVKFREQIEIKIKLNQSQRQANLRISHVAEILTRG